MHIAIPPPPPLIPDLSGPVAEEERTNTLALLLPHTSLFTPPILELLRAHYEQFGPIAHWAPVKGFGRVIVVWQEEGDAERAKEEGGRLWLDVNVDVRDGGEGQSGQVEEGKKGHQRRASQPHPSGGYVAFSWVPRAAILPELHF